MHSYDVVGLLFGMVFLMMVIFGLSNGGHLRSLFSNRGEVGEGEEDNSGGPSGESSDDKGGDKGGGGDDDDLLASLISIEDYDDKGVDDDDGEKKKPADKAKGGRQDNGRDEEFDKLLEKNRQLNRALHEERQSKKKGGEKDDAGADTVLSREELKKIMTEYKDDPDTLLRVIEYQAGVAAKSAAGKALSAKDAEARAGEAKGLLSSQFPDIYVEDSNLHNLVKGAKEYLGLDGEDPMSDLYAFGSVVLKQLPAIMKAKYEEGFKAAGGKSPREKEIAGKKPTANSGGSKSGGSTDDTDVSDVARRIGFTDPKKIALLKKLRASSKPGSSVIVEG